MAEQEIFVLGNILTIFIASILSFAGKFLAVTMNFEIIIYYLLAHNSLKILN